mmetsp:Transcript_31824/g.57600  ORF Transcript_31824/g.57600 Transcript_31824/m.57600 type:complete len:681 (-) Transcript_31824:53-2095(-)
MGNEISSTTTTTTIVKPCKIVIQSKVGDITTHANNPNDTWAALCHRTIENDYLSKLLPLLVQIYPEKRLCAYRLRYDLGFATIVRPTWHVDGMNHDVPVEDAFIDVNVSLRPSNTSTTRNDFAPHETILSSLGEEGTQNTTFVEVHFEEIGNGKNVNVKNGVVGPFPVTNGKTHVLFCSEHERLPGCIDEHKCGELLANGENSHLPGKCINMFGEEDDQMEMENFAFTSGDAGDVGGVEEAQGGEDGIPENGGKNKDESSGNVSKKEQRKRKRYGTEKENDLPNKVDNTKGEYEGGAEKSTGEPSSRKKTSAKTTTKTGTDKKAASSKVRSAAKKSGTKEKIVSSKETKTIAQDVERLTSKKKTAPSKNTAEVVEKPSTEKNEVEDESKSTKKQKRKQNQDNAKKMPASPTKEEDVPIPAKGFPAGWTTCRVSRPNSTTKQKDLRLYSPKMNHMFRTKVEAKLFLEKLEDAGGDEDAAILLHQQKEGKKAVTMGKKSTGGDNNAHVENGEKTNMSKVKNKRKTVETNATKKAEKDDTSKSPVPDGETPRKKAKPTKEKVAVEDTEEAVQQAITGKSEKAKVGNRKKKSSDDTKKKSASAKKVIDPNRPKRPSNAFILFSSAVRPKIKKEHPELKGSEVVTKLGEIYRATGPDELQPYIDKAGEALAKYKVDMKAYTQMLV